MKYAIVTTADPRLLPGVNALLNSLDYYGNDVEFHLLYWDSKDGVFDSYCRAVEPIFKNLIAVDLQRWCLRRDMPIIYPGQKAAFYLKFMRHFYPPHELDDYDAVCIMDADMAIVNNLMPYFKACAITKKILVPNNADKHSQDYDNWSDTAFAGAYAPPYHSMPLFFIPRIHSGVLHTIPTVGLQIGRGEMTAVNKVLLYDIGTDNILIQPNMLWVQRRWEDYTIEEHYSDGRRYLRIAGDRLYTIHGRWWTQAAMDKYGEHDTAKILYDTYRYFNTECRYKLDWKWGDYNDRR